MTKKELCAAAIKASKAAYAPYSGYKVGAALYTSSGKIYTGCNIENAAYSPSVCAERTAVFKAVSEGEKDFVMMAVAGGKNGELKGLFPPCGVCRQVLSEFCRPDFLVLIVKNRDDFQEMTLQSLLPEAFRIPFPSDRIDTADKLSEKIR